MTKARRKIDAGLRARNAVEALREQATANDPAPRYQVHPNQFRAWKKQLPENTGRAFDPKVGLDAEAASAREIEKTERQLFGDDDRALSPSHRRGCQRGAR